MQDNRLLKPLTIPDGITRPDYIPALDGFRGVAIGLVLLHHCFGKAFAFFWIGVDLFFVLSGFLITRILLASLGKDGYLLNFFSRRVLRIFPAYYFALLILVVVLPAIIPAFARQIAYLIDHQGWYWTYTENWLYKRDGWSPGGSMILSHFWSLAIEEQYYLVWPFVVLLFRGRALIVAIFTLVATAIALRLSGLLHNPGYYVATYTRMDSLLLGALLATLLYQHRLFINRFAKIILAISGLALVIGMALTRQPEYSNPFLVKAGYTLLALFFASLVAIVLEERDNIVKRICRFRPLTFLGKYSYGLYIFHFPVYWLLKDPVLAGIMHVIHSDSMAKLATSVVCACLAVAMALISFHVIEKPFLRLKNYFSTPSSVPVPEKVKVEE